MGALVLTDGWFRMLQVGITMVGSASLLSGEGSSSGHIDPFFILLGMALIILSQVICKLKHLQGAAFFAILHGLCCIDI